ncbi:D-amino acid dehydrogenase [Sinorhizobium meliloti]|uniref:D-amino acid dehydrogenase n=1 Tax=Rhizobium meliloti TaxID=382 RepID=UPI0001E4B62C|nr:D-amino acid dehydrogenase [Sinorhizobium meliloti]AEG57926.1 D-amino-acid dehydrogenase [Sinorhizobium meliloti AK83]MDE4587378.1 D-amino acid dehydrogenase [Sinorhizobium meliloti]RVG93499.1 FAD-dependent oxidoreductase [Sinorhizobium meliloti]SEJ86866.1 D-amino-acid dehydrogenase [Sinorhizobium meliloti]
MRVAVLGAGVVGSATAYMLARDGHEVSVIDRCDRPGMETSFANGGLMTPSDSSPWNSPGTVRRIGKMLFDSHSTLKINPSAVPSIVGWGLKFLANSTTARHKANMVANIRIASLSLETLRSIRKATTLNYDQTTRGTMRAFPRGGRMARFVQMCREMEEWGVKFEVLNQEQILEKEPCLKDVIDRYIGAVFFPDDESGDAHKFTSEMARLATELGARFLMNTSVLEIVKQSSSRISHVRTSNGDVRADAYVLSLGSYSPILTRTLGIHLPIVPVKGYSVTLPLNGWNGGPTRPVMDDGFHAMMVPMGDRLRMGGKAEFARFDTEVDPKEGRRVLNDILKILPAMASHVDVESASSWSGLRPMTPGGPPIVGPTPYNNLFLNTGHGPLGWTMSCGSAKIAADFITHGRVLSNRVDPRNYAL